MKKIVLFAVWLSFGATSLQADIIYFKDGMKTVCLEKAWEENDEVKCEYDGVILSYQKSAVLRIEKRRAPKPKADVIPHQESNTGGDNKTFTQIPVTPKKNGVTFYDPRRPQKYWISATSKYNTFQEAVAALAKQYDRSPQWIQNHMGETNDLHEIHRNLASSKINASQTPTTDEPVRQQIIEFYNPRRAQKYWTSSTSKHNTFLDAIAALAEQYDRTPQWVQKYMGQTNDLHIIHENLATRKANESSQ